MGLDRLRGARLGAVCTRFLIHHMTEGWNGTKVKTCTNDSACVIGIKDRFEVATPFSQLKSETDFKLRKPKTCEWANANRLIRVLEGTLRESDPKYQAEASVQNVDGSAC